MPEWENPERKYKWFRPRQAMRGQGNISPTNRATISLYNDTKGRNFLIVRDVRVQGLTTIRNQISYLNAQIGSTTGCAQQPLLPSAPALGGTVYAIDTSTVYPPDFLMTSLTGIDATWPHDFPFAVLEPGWSLVVQSATTGGFMYVDFLWESIEPDQLDWFW
jgi:hypothetical protein